jgi:HPt (histidine-containing phosphotransfer) domain-containing protein
MSSGSSNMPDPVDLERLREFSDGTDDGLRALAALMLDELEEAARALGRAAGAADATELAAVAHRASGTAGACGAEALAAVLMNIETTAHAHHGEPAAAQLPLLERELAAVRHFLRNAVFVER